MGHHRDLPVADIHIAYAWAVDDTTERDALTLVTADIGKIVRVGAAAPYDFYILRDDTGPSWLQLGGSGGGGTAAADVSITPNGDIAATNVQAAIVEVRDDTDTKLATKADDSATTTALAARVQVAGQIGGTAASPDVRGVRETSGPTLLTLGAVADGEYLVRAGAAIVGGTPAGGGGITIRGIRISASGSYYEQAAPATGLLGDATSGFETMVIAIVDRPEGVGARRAVVSNTGLFFGEGVRFTLDSVRPNMSIAESGGAQNAIFVGAWARNNATKALVVINYGWTGTERFLMVNGQDFARTSQATFGPGTALPWRLLAEAADASNPGTGITIVGLAHKDVGGLTDAEREEAIRTFLTTGDLPDLSFTSRFSMQALSVGAAPATITDEIGAEVLTRVGTDINVVQEGFADLAVTQNPSRARSTARPRARRLL
jgi:hypothetical protein